MSLNKLTIYKLIFKYRKKSLLILNIFIMIKLDFFFIFYKFICDCFCLNELNVCYH